MSEYLEAWLGTSPNLRLLASALIIEPHVVLDAMHFLSLLLFEPFFNFLSFEKGVYCLGAKNQMTSFELNLISLWRHKRNGIPCQLCNIPLILEHSTFYFKSGVWKYKWFFCTLTPYFMTKNELEKFMEGIEKYQYFSELLVI